MRFLPAGDVCLVVEFDADIGEALNQRLRSLDQLLTPATLPGIVETVPSFRSLLVYYDPLVVGYQRLREAIAERIECSARLQPPLGRRLDIPCCYEGDDFGSDLQAAARRLGIEADGLVRLHSAAEYLVYFIGFAPGQPYLTGLPRALEIPRLETPRTRTPAGSVGIGGRQCCIYSVESPGGFWVLGRTPLRLYDPDAAEPTLLRAGDRLRFHAIARGEYERIATQVASDSYRLRLA